LKEADYNPRKINKVQAKRLRDGIKMHGLVGGIIWNKRTGNIVSGHQRLSQLDELEGTQDYSLDVDVIDVNEKRERAINVLLNNHTAQGEFDGDKLAEVIEYLREEQISVEQTGFNMADLQVMLGDDFLTGEMGEQRDVEADAIAALTKVRGDSKENESEFFGNEKESISTTVPTPPVEKDETGAPIGEPKSNYKDELKQRKGDLLAENAEEEDADFAVTLVFDNNKMLVKFLSHIGLDVEKRYFDRFEVETALGIDLTD